MHGILIFEPLTRARGQGGGGSGRLGAVLGRAEVGGMCAEGGIGACCVLRAEEVRGPAYVEGGESAALRAQRGGVYTCRDGGLRQCAHKGGGGWR